MAPNKIQRRSGQRFLFNDEADSGRNSAWGIPNRQSPEGKAETTDRHCGALLHFDKRIGKEP